MHGIEKILAGPRHRLDGTKEDGLGLRGHIREILIHEIDHVAHGLAPDEGLDEPIVIRRSLLQKGMVHDLRNEDHRNAEAVPNGGEQPDVVFVDLR